MLGLDVSIIVITCVAALVWLLANRSLPSARIAVFDESSDHVARAGAKIASLSVVKGIAGVTALTGAAAIALFALAIAGLKLSTNSPDNLASIINFRDKLDGMLEAIGVVSTTAWVVVLAFLSLLWLIAARSSSERRWKEAVGARRGALMASLKNESLDALKESLGGPTSEHVMALESRIREVMEENNGLIEKCRAVPVVELGDEGTALSLRDLAALQAELRDSQNGELQPDEDPEAIEETQRAMEFADHLDEIISNVEQQLEVTLQKLDGSTRSITLQEAGEYIEPDDDEVQQALKEALVGKRLQNHEAEASVKTHAEPELIREWIGSAVASKASVEGSAKAGKIGARLALVAIILSLIGFNASVVGADISLKSQVIELSLLTDQNSARVEEAAAAVKNEVEVAETEELASDEETVEYLQHALRIQVARSLVASTTDAVARTRLRRSAFQLAAVNARQQVLGASTRDAAKRLDKGAASQSFQASAAGQQPAEIFDDALDPRIRQLRENPTLWTRLRHEAARPAARNDINNALFKAAFTADHSLHPHATNVYVEIKASHFAEQVAKNGGTGNANLPGREIPTGELPLSGRERRIIADFEVGLPGQLDSRVNAYNSGRVDPGSLNRVAMRSTGKVSSAVNATSRSAGHVSSAFRSAGHYDELFPAVARAVDAGSIAGNAVASASRASTNAARSFSRIRFSGRVGGVVIGRSPDNPDVELEVTDIQWHYKGNKQIYIELTTAAKRKIKLGPFQPAIVHHAMAYVADGRVVTTTLPQPRFSTEDNGELNIQARRVVVHPAFEDTAFACRAIQVDRFVDSYMYDKTNNSEVAMILQATRAGVTQLGRLLEYLGSTPSYERGELLQQIQNRQGDAFYQPIETVTKICGTGAQCFPIENYTKLGFGYMGVAEYLACLQGSGIGNCKAMLEFVSPTAAYSVDSGVRESAFLVDTELNFLTGKLHRDDPLWPLDFMIQAVPQNLSRGNVETEEGWNPWEFPSIANQLRSVVIAGINSDKGAQEVLGHMKEFTVLQRLFRVGFSGDLGFNFPIGKLVALQNETRQAVKIERHERWNMNDEVGALLVESEKYFASVLSSLGKDSSVDAECSAAISEAVEESTDKPWPSGSGIFRFVGELENTCKDTILFDNVIQRRNQLRKEELIDEAIYFAQQRQIPLSGRQFICPSL